VTREKICIELQRLSNVALELQDRNQAHFALHRAACLAADAEEILERRQALHVTLDRLLDNGEAIQRLTAELETLP